MQRHRRRTPEQKKRGIENWESVSELKGLVEAQLKHRQLKAELELLKLEERLNQQIKKLQNQRLNQLKMKRDNRNETSQDDV